MFYFGRLMQIVAIIGMVNIMNLTMNSQIDFPWLGIALAGSMIGIGIFLEEKSR